MNDSNLEKPLLAIFASRDIQPGEELCINYSGDDGIDDIDKDKAKSTSGQGRRDKVYAACMCGANNCQGTVFEPPVSFERDRS